MLQGMHVVQAVSQLDQDDPEVFRHGDQHLAVVFRQEFLVGLVFVLVQLGDPVNDEGHVGAELFLNVVVGDRGVFNRVMQKAGSHRVRVQA